MLIILDEATNIFARIVKSRCQEHLMCVWSWRYFQNWTKPLLFCLQPHNEALFSRKNQFHFFSHTSFCSNSVILVFHAIKCFDDLMNGCFFIAKNIISFSINSKNQFRKRVPTCRAIIRMTIPFLFIFGMTIQ